MVNKVVRFLLLAVALVLLNTTRSVAQEIFKNNLSDSINTEFAETKPMISTDGAILYFARQNSPQNIGGRDDDQDIFISSYGKYGWTNAINAGRVLNNERPNGVVSISATGNTLYLLDAYEDAKNAGGISISHRTDSGWTKPERLATKDFYNKSEYIDYFFSSNGKELLLAVEREDTHGDQDLYVSKKMKDGSWSTPLNLGDRINTKMPEFSPFLAADNKSLFFSSMGHENYGSADIFYSKRLDSTWTNWSTPKNLGPDVNTEDFEAYYTLPAQGSIGYYVSAQGGRAGSRDIFSITIPYEFRPEPVILLQGKFLVSNDEEDSVAYDVNFLTTSASESEVNIDYEANHFNAMLPTGGAYFFYVKKEGFISESHYIDLTNQKEYMVEDADIHTVPVKEGSDFISHNIQFEKGNSEFDMSAYFELVRLLEVFKKYEGLQFELIGHAHDLKDSTENFKLSKERLEKIKSFYVDNGLKDGQFIIRPKGNSEMNTDKYKKHTNSNFDVNNRIEFLIKSTDWKPKEKAQLPQNQSPDNLHESDLNFEDAKKLSFTINFGFDSYKIEATNNPLKEIEKAIRDMNADTVSLEGYTCNYGDEGYNTYLASKRAKAVKEWLLEKGLKSNYIEMKGLGEQNPLTTNETIEARKKNRRVEISFTAIKKFKSERNQ